MTQNLKPKLSSPFPKGREFWTCPVTGLKVPKRLGANLRYRETILREAETDKGFRNDLMAACAASRLFWFNAFVWTYKQFDIDPVTGEAHPSTNPHWPFITWDVQDLFIDEIGRAINEGHDLGIKKSRDMGASWSSLGVFHHEWLFDEQGPQLLELSRVREFVDQTGNMKALFQKHDYINEWLPEWMIPPGIAIGGKYRTKMHMKNIITGGCIDGESTTEHAASGDRRKAILLDEFAKVEYGTKMRSATADVAPCRIVNSTPAGAHTEYSRWINSGKIKVFVLPWYEHPEKGAGRYVSTDAITGEFKIRSPWYDSEDERRSSKTMAQEVDMNDLESGEVYFSPQMVEKHRTLFSRRPHTTICVSLDPKISDDSMHKVIQRNNWKADVKCSRTGKSRAMSIFVPLVGGRPDQRNTYTIGIDVSKGQGASNSTLEILCDQTGDKIAEWADANTPAYELARVIVAVALWCGGRNPRRLPFLIWEKNGAGWDLGRSLVKIYRYPFYYFDKQVGTFSEKKTRKYGWQNSVPNNRLVMDKYLRLFETGKYIEPSDKCLDEMKEYIIYPTGNIGPAGLVEEDKATRLAHGDRVRGTSLALWGIEAGAKIKRGKLAIPPNSPAARRKAALAKNKKDRSGYKHTYDFANGGA